MSSREEKLLIAISRVRNLLFRDLESIFANNNLTNTQFAVLEVLYSKGDLCVGDIQRYILGTNGNIPVVINNLEKQNLVERKKMEKDRRVSIISLTKEGEQLISKVYPIQKERLKVLFNGIDDKTIDETIKNLFEIYKNVSNAQRDE